MAFHCGGDRSQTNSASAPTKPLPQFHALSVGTHSTYIAGGINVSWSKSVLLAPFLISSNPRHLDSEYDDFFHKVGKKYSNLVYVCLILVPNKQGKDSYIFICSQCGSL